MVEWIVRRLGEQGLRVAILSRGYRAATVEAVGDGEEQEQSSVASFAAELVGMNDEALELQLALGDVPHLQNPDRWESASQAVQQFGAQALVLDDGFQHRRLARDLDVVLLDASEPFGFERLLPRGTLREPVGGLSRAGVIVLSRADMLNAAGREAVRRKAQSLCPQGAWCEVEHLPAALAEFGGACEPLANAKNQRVAAFCGIGNPAGFRHTLATLNCRVTAWREFPDHHAYSPADLDDLDEWVRQSQAKLVLCTRKDLVKLRVADLGGAPLRAVWVELRFLAGEEAMKAALERVIATRPE
jgi:tetraacyldisaccharide 4'-kinase